MKCENLFLKDWIFSFKFHFLYGHFSMWVIIEML